MSRKRIWLVGGVLLVLGSVASALYWSTRQPPQFYREALRRDVPVEVRRQQAKEFVQSTLQLVDTIRHEDRWSQEFGEDQVNAWIIEDLNAQYAAWIPAGVSEPRVKFEDETLLVAFRLQQKGWSGIVSATLKPWVSRPNELAVEIAAVRWGLLPVPTDEIVTEAIRSIRRAGYRAEVQQRNGHDVVVVDLANHTANHAVLEDVRLLAGKLQLAGRRKKPDSLALRD